MRVGVAADSGGDVAALCRAFRLLKDQLACEKLFFLGGNWEDVDGFHEATAEATLPPMVEVVTPGPMDLETLLRAALPSAAPPPAPPPTEEDREPVVRVAEKSASSAPEDQKLIEMLGATLCILVHNKADITKDDLTNANLILHGKSKKPAVVRIGARTFITPGPVGGTEPSVAVLNHSTSGLDVEFYDLNGALLFSENITMTSTTRFSVK